MIVHTYNNHDIVLGGGGEGGEGRKKKSVTFSRCRHKGGKLCIVKARPHGSPNL